MPMIKKQIWAKKMTRSDQTKRASRQTHMLSEEEKVVSDSLRDLAWGAEIEEVKARWL